MTKLFSPLFIIIFSLACVSTGLIASDLHAQENSEELFERLKTSTSEKSSSKGKLFKHGHLHLRPVSFSDLPSWKSDKQNLAIPTFLRSCAVLSSGNGKGANKGAYKVPGSKSQWQRVCRLANKLDSTKTADAQTFFQSEFKPYEVVDKKRPAGLFTGYYEPEVVGSLKKTATYKYPLYAKPKELVRFKSASVYTGKHRHDWGVVKNGRSQKYFSRGQIEKGALRGRGLELVYLANPVDAFFIHIQGSTRIRLTNGKVMRVGFAAKNGHPYQSIGRVLIDWGELARHKVSMGSIRNWAQKNPARTPELLSKNRSFIFFRELKISHADGPLGAQGVPLTGGRSMAIDKRLHAYGVPMWIETFAPNPDTKKETPFNRLMIAQDTGSAIRGAVRGDIYLGTGKKAGKIAGMLKHPGRLIILVPRDK